MSPVQIILNEEVFFFLDDKSSLPKIFHSPVPLCKNKVPLQHWFNFICRLTVLENDFFFFFFCSLENGDWSHLRISKLQMDEAAQPAHVFRFSSLTNRPFPFTVTEAPEPAAHLIPKVLLTCSYTSGTSVGITVLWKPPDPHSTRSVPGLIPFCPSSGGKAPTGCSLSPLSICMPRTGKGSEMDLMLNYLSPR